MSNVQIMLHFEQNEHGNQPAVSRKNQSSIHLLQLTHDTGLLALPGPNDGRNGVVSLMAEVCVRTRSLKSK